MSTLLTAIFSVLFSVAAQFCLKAGMSSDAVRATLAGPFGLHSALAILSNRYVFGGFALYGLGAAVWLAVLSKWDVSKAYPLVGLGFVFTLAVGWLIGEQVTITRAIGVTFICLGVVLVGKT